MSRFHSHLNSAMNMLKVYDGKEPFHIFIKKQFAASRKFGSKDRKQISQLCYSFFRMGKAVLNSTLEEKILTAYFLCSETASGILEALKPAWNEKADLPLCDKLELTRFPINSVFPWTEELSHEIDHHSLSSSYFIQPGLFLRLRPGKKESVIRKLNEGGIKFWTVSESSIAMSNAAKIDALIDLDKEAVIQDLGSQHTGTLFKNAIKEMHSKARVWDCCAGSGGKSIMMYDLFPGIQLTVSDIRDSVINNLKTRFQKSGIQNYHSKQIDLTKESLPQKEQFDLIVADVPCTGSGTWGRTPEQLYFFNESAIEKYAALQRKIISSVIPHLKKGGKLIYITCSVFRKENEEIAEFISNKTDLKLMESTLFKGYEQKADTLYAALFSS